MADAVKAEGLVIAATDASGNVYPFACTKDVSINITRDFLELTPKTNTIYREYIKGRQSYTITGNGLVKIVESSTQPITFFDGFIEGTDTVVAGTTNSFVGYLDMIDAQNNYKLYKFGCIFQDLTLTSSVGQNAQYSFTLQGNGPITELTVVDTYTVSSGTIPARSTATHKLVAVGYRGKWYYNYTVSAGPVITLGTSLNGVSVVAAYIAL
jgi:hypothetical protein